MSSPGIKSRGPRLLRSHPVPGNLGDAGNLVAPSRKNAFGLARLCAALLAAAGVLGACDKASAPAPAPTQAPQAVTAQPAPKKPSADFSGVVRGIVKLAPGAVLPIAAEPPKKPVNAAAPCRPYGEDDRRVVSQFAGTGGLTPIHLAITQMTAVPEHKPTTHNLYIRNCRLTPALLGAMVGDTLHIVNESEAPFMPVFPGDPFMKGLLKGEVRDIELKRYGPAIIACGFAGYCGESMVITVPHPLYAVTNERGEFEIRGVPLEQNIMVHAGHALFEVGTVQTRLTKAEPEKTLEILIKPTSPEGAAPFMVRAPGKPGAAGKAGDKAPAKTPEPVKPDPIK